MDKQQRFSKVSVSEFLNNWIRPEVKGLIMSYALSSPHAEEIKRSPRRRRRLVSRLEGYGSGRQSLHWVERPIGGATQCRRFGRGWEGIPQSETDGWMCGPPDPVNYLYAELGKPHDPAEDAQSDKMIYDDMYYDDEVSLAGDGTLVGVPKRGHFDRWRISRGFSTNKGLWCHIVPHPLSLKYVNKLVKSLRVLKLTQRSGAGWAWQYPNCRLLNKLQENNIKGRTKMAKANASLASNRGPAIRALIAL